MGIWSSIVGGFLHPNLTAQAAKSTAQSPNATSKAAEIIDTLFTSEDERLDKQAVLVGIALSEEAVLEITVDQVNDLPEISCVSGDRDVADDGKQNVLSEEGYIVNPTGERLGVLQGVKDVEDDPHPAADVTIRLDGAHGDLFEVRLDADDNHQIVFAGADEDRLPDGAIYDVVVVVVDSDGGESTPFELPITEGGMYLEDASGTRTYSNGLVAGVCQCWG